jgi:ribosomal protein L9
VSAPQYQAELAEEEILRVQAERAADFAMYQLERQRQTEPQRTREAKAQLEQDKESFAKICRQNSLSQCQANFHLFQSTHSISDLAPASQEELVKFEQARIETHNDALQNLGHDQLRARVREEAEARQEATKQEQAARELESAKQRDAFGGYKPLPIEIDRKAIMAASAVQLKQWMKVYGDLQITVRLRESASAASSAQEN